MWCVRFKTKPRLQFLWKFAISWNGKFNSWLNHETLFEIFLIRKCIKTNRKRQKQKKNPRKQYLELRMTLNWKRMHFFLWWISVYQKNGQKTSKRYAKILFQHRYKKRQFITVADYSICHWYVATEYRHQ